MIFSDLAPNSITILNKKFPFSKIWKHYLSPLKHLLMRTQCYPACLMEQS